MKQCKKQWKDHASDRVDKHGIPIVDVPDYKDYYYSGWKAALEMVLSHREPYYNIEDKKVVATDSDIIYKELEK